VKHGGEGSESADLRIGRRRTVVQRFDRIAATYDLLNHLLSFGADRAWRRRALRRAGLRGRQSWLDMATGSGDFVAAGLRLAPASRWVAVDPSAGLLGRFRRRPRLAGVPVLLGAAEAIPLGDGAVDGATIAFGLRNFADPVAGLGELRRVLRPGGLLVILEFHPAAPGRWGGGLTRFYLEKVIPLVGGIVSGDREAYSYLARSSGGFWSAGELAEMLQETGFSNVKQETWMFGAVTLTLADRL
jgi:demethylmenaquinone methyltransferase/2-methoxy-6-polyprenyl-1,4-benzoquinol methylase